MVSYVHKVYQKLRELVSVMIRILTFPAFGFIGDQFRLHHLPSARVLKEDGTEKHRGMCTHCHLMVTLERMWGRETSFHKLIKSTHRSFQPSTLKGDANFLYCINFDFSKKNAHRW